MDPASTVDDPIFLRIDSPYELARWRPLVNWVLVIPHSIIVGVLQVLASLLFFVYWLVLIFTGKLNPGLYGAMLMYERYSSRANGFLLGFSETYPPFDFNTGPADNGAYPPITLILPESPGESVPRTRAFNIFLAIPHYVVMMVYGIGAVAVALVGWFAVLFTGAWPSGMRDFLVRVGNYYYRIWTYVTMVADSYPKFNLPPA